MYNNFCFKKPKPFHLLCSSGDELRSPHLHPIVGGIKFFSEPHDLLWFLRSQLWCPYLPVCKALWFLYSHVEHPHVIHNLSHCSRTQLDLRFCVVGLLHSRVFLSLTVFVSITCILPDIYIAFYSHQLCASLNQAKVMAQMCAVENDHKNEHFVFKQNHFLLSVIANIWGRNMVSLCIYKYFQCIQSISQCLQQIIIS